MPAGPITFGTSASGASSIAFTRWQNAMFSPANTADPMPGAATSADFSPRPGTRVTGPRAMAPRLAVGAVTTRTDGGSMRNRAELYTRLLGGPD